MIDQSEIIMELASEILKLKRQLLNQQEAATDIMSLVKSYFKNMSPSEFLKVQDQITDILKGASRA